MTLNMSLMMDNGNYGYFMVFSGFLGGRLFQTSFMRVCLSIISVISGSLNRLSS